MKECSSTLVSSEGGFTLLEILIAITLLAFITIGVVSITENASLTSERTTEMNKNNLQVETAMGRFEWDVAQIYSPLYFSTVMNLNPNANALGNQGLDDGGADGGSAGQVGGQPGTAGTANAGTPTGGGMGQNPMVQQYYQQLLTRFETNEHFQAVSQEGHPIPRFHAPDKSTFEFFTSSNRRKLQNTRQSHFAWVRYTLGNQDALPDGEEHPDIPRSLKSLVRYYTAEDPYNIKRIDPQDGSAGVKAAVLLRNVESLEFQFWDLERRRWETNLRTIQNGESVIRGVKMTLSWYDSSANKRVATRIFRTHWPLLVPQDQGGMQGMQGGMNAGMQGGMNAGMQGGMNAGMQGGMNAGMQGGMNAGTGF